MKYYVTIDSHQGTYHAGNPYQACMKALRQKFDKYTDVVGNAFRVSQKGFETHNDDEIIETELILKLMMLANQPTPELDGYHQIF